MATKINTIIDTHRSIYFVYSHILIVLKIIMALYFYIQNETRQIYVVEFLQ